MGQRALSRVAFAAWLKRFFKQFFKQFLPAPRPRRSAKPRLQALHHMELGNE